MKRLLALTVLSLWVWGTALVCAEPFLGIPEFPFPTVVCREQFGLIVCRAPGQRLPVWEPYCEDNGAFPHPICIPALREV